MNQLKTILTDQDTELITELEDSYEELERALLGTEQEDYDLLLFLVGVPDKDWIK